MKSVRRRVETIPLGSVSEDLPVLVLESGVEGPTVAVTANVHGDEVTGLAAVHQLDRLLQSALEKGTVLLYPSLNPSGLVHQRRVTQDDGLDLNRAFPGNARGHGAARIAGMVWAAVQARSPQALIDLHADSAVAIPYVIVDRSTRLKGEERTAMDATLRTLATESGLTVLHEYPDDLYMRFRLDRSLAGAMVNHAGIPAVTLEVGPRRAVFADAVEITVGAVLRILRSLGLVESAPEALPGPVSGGPWRRAAAPRVGASGVFVPALRPGSSFRRGDPLGEVRAVDGTVREVIRAEAAGLVVSWSEHAWIDARGVPGTLGLLDG